MFKGNKKLILIKYGDNEIRKLEKKESVTGFIQGSCSIACQYANPYTTKICNIKIWFLAKQSKISRILFFKIQGTLMQFEIG